MNHGNNKVCSTTCCHDRCFFLFGLSRQSLEGKQPPSQVGSMPFLAKAQPCSKLDHTNRHLSYASSTSSETRTLHADYAALLLGLDSLQHSPSIVTRATVVDTDKRWMR